MRYVLNLHLITSEVFDDGSYHSHFGEGKWKLTKYSLVIARGKKSSILYMIQAKLCKMKMNIAEDFLTELWHKWLIGHISEKGLEIFARKKLLSIKDTFLKICIDCLTDRQCRLAFHKSPLYRRSYILDLIHTDVCTMDARTLDDILYFINFIDVHSKKVYAFVLKSKDQALDVYSSIFMLLVKEI